MYTWNWEPTLLLGLAGQTSAYLVCIGPLRHLFRGSMPVARGQIVQFLLGVFTLFVALVSPIDRLGEGISLSAHMVQHLMLTLVAPPLLLAGTPRWLLRPLVSTPLTLKIGRFITHPLVAFFIFNIVFIGWHVPYLYELTLHNQFIHIFEHLMFFGTATLTWWPVFSALDELPAPSPGLQCIYLFFQSLPPTILGALITFASVIVYPTYARSPGAFGLSPILDQHTAGLIMWVPGSLAYFTVLTIVFFRWVSDDEDKYDAVESTVMTR